MALPFKFLLELVESETLFAHLDEERKKGGFRWKGPHFPVLARYVLSLRFYNHVRYTDLLVRVEESARLCWETEEMKYEVLQMIYSFLPELGWFFIVPRRWQLLSDTTAKRNELVSAFINFLVEATEAFLGQEFLSRDISAWINALLEELKFLLVILGVEVEETKTNILVKIESIANQTGLFVHSFFFTARYVKDAEIVVAISDLLPKFTVTREKIKQHCALPSFTTPTGDTQRLRFSDLLRRVEESAYLYCKTENSLTRHINLVNFLQAMDSFLPELKQFFTVPTPQQLLSATTPKRNELVAAFVNFLVEAFEKIQWQKHSSTFIHVGIHHLLKELKFILFILGDTPFRCVEVEETQNILADIESITNEVGLFLHSFFFTTDHVKNSKIEAALAYLFQKFEMMEEKIKKHCIAFSKLLGVTTPNTALVSLFIVDSVLDYLNYLINNEAYMIVEVKDQITTLREELQLFRSFLGDIDLTQDEDLIKQAIQLRDLAYEVEYILTWSVSLIVPDWYMTLRLSHFIQKNKCIVTAIPETKLKNGINSLQVVESRRQLSSQVSNSTQIDEEIIVGLNDETMKIASQLVGGQGHLQIISITGMPGLGKTTLAKKLYNHSSVVNYFDQRLWCVVSQTYQRTRLLREILSSIHTVKEDKLLEKEREDSKLGEYLYKSLKKRRYLIVMDDIWDIQAWNDVKMYFPEDNTRSRVLFTTRHRHWALEASSDAIINELSLLSADQCWNLLQQKVFQKSVFPSELEQIGKQIATGCKGLPLAVAGIAAVLANIDITETSWKQVLESVTSYISRDHDILELSYKHLPIHLRPCFLYFIAFEEDREISVKKLLSLWISEGFIRANKDRRSEEIAEEYLIELINRNMVQVAKKRSDNGVKACKVHDLMHNMALRIAEQEKFLKVIEDGFSLYEQHHRLCNRSYSRDIKSRLFGLHIRSLSGIPMSSFNASHVRLVRVLQCKDSRDGIDGFGTPLVQLRYLEMQSMFQMPEEINNLEFLFVTKLTFVEKDFSELPKLRHLEFKHSPVFSENMKFSQHYCLETLSGIRLDNSINKKFMRCFPNLRRLKCYYSEQCPDVSFLSQLESLSMTFPSLEVNFRAMNFATNIKKLSIYGGCFEIISSIGKLPNLEILKLALLDFKEGNWTTNDDEFQKLKFLKLSDAHLKKWITSSDDHFPMLEQLVLENCEYLKGIPLELGYIPTMQMIEVHSCNKSVEESALEILKEQQEYGNEVMQVIINGYKQGN